MSPDAAAPAYDVPLSYDEARRIAFALRVLTTEVSPSVDRLGAASDARLFAEMLGRRLAAPRSV